MDFYIMDAIHPSVIVKVDEIIILRVSYEERKGMVLEKLFFFKSHLEWRVAKKRGTGTITDRPYDKDHSNLSKQKYWAIVLSWHVHSSCSA